MLSLGWLRETINFPTPQSQSNTIVVRDATHRSDSPRLLGVWPTSLGLLI